MRPIVIGTRGSSLAMCQAQIVQTKLEERFPERTYQLKTIQAQADKNIRRYGLQARKESH